MQPAGAVKRDDCRAAVFLHAVRRLRKVNLHRRVEEGDGLRRCRGGLGMADAVVADALEGIGVPVAAGEGS